MVVACPLSADEDSDAQARWCADVRTDGDQASVVAAENRDAQSVRMSWTEPAAVEAAGAGHYAGGVLAHDSVQGTVEALTAGGPPPPGEQEGRSERLLRVGYNAADSFVVMSPQADHHDATVDQYRCVLQAAFDVDDATIPTCPSSTTRAPTALQAVHVGRRQRVFASGAE